MFSLFKNLPVNTSSFAFKNGICDFLGFGCEKLKIGKRTFIHKKAILEGDIEIGDNCSVWAGAVLRGDNGKIKIGDNTSIQDNCVFHDAVEVGKNVTVGHAAVVHGCKIADNVIVGMNSSILTGAVIGEWSIVAAGSVVRENQEIPSNSLAAGIPAKIKRKLTEEDRERITFSWKAYTEKMLPKKLD